MFLSEVIVQGGGIHCKVEGIVLSVEEPTELRGGKFQKTLQEVRGTQQGWNVAGQTKKLLREAWISHVN